MCVCVWGGGAADRGASKVAETGCSGKKGQLAGYSRAVIVLLRVDKLHYNKC